MPSDYVKDLVDHKQRVTGHMRTVADHLLKRIIEKGNVLPFTLETEESTTLIDLLDVACKLKRDTYGARFHLSKQVSDVVQNTIAYLAPCEGNTPVHWLVYCVQDLFGRAAVHDNSKFTLEEFEAYEEAFPELQRYAYGTKEFKLALSKIAPAIRHHYQVNDHHPEFFENGVNAMHCVQHIEMTADWKAASERSKTDFMLGLEMNKERFSIDNQLLNIIKNTVKWYAS